jgi:hypothetical protein
MRLRSCPVASEWSATEEKVLPCPQCQPKSCRKICLIVSSISNCLFDNAVSSLWPRNDNGRTGSCRISWALPLHRFHARAGTARRRSSYYGGTVASVDILQQAFRAAGLDCHRMVCLLQDLGSGLNKLRAITPGREAEAEKIFRA